MLSKLLLSVRYSDLPREKVLEQRERWKNSKRGMFNGIMFALGDILEYYITSRDNRILSVEEMNIVVGLFKYIGKNKETEYCFRGKYDKGNAILSIYSGAGGQDAQDWAAMLLRMYERYSDQKGFKNVLIDEALGEEGGGEAKQGIKSATIEIKGKFAYGFLKRETGVHRLVRLSPFDAQKLRHTSFVLVEVLPDLSDNNEVEIKPEDLRIDFYKSSGPGGQYVNKRESAVRITHLPTGITVACQSERLQGKNRDKCMAILAAKLYQFEEEKKEKELKGIKGEKISASWGNQIRSYVLHPYKLVKDLRTDVESSDPEKVLDGDLDKFIEAEIKLN
jgi:peptide chain release factor 2